MWTAYLYGPRCAENARSMPRSALWTVADRLADDRPVAHLPTEDTPSQRVYALVVRQEMRPDIRQLKCDRCQRTRAGRQSLDARMCRSGRPRRQPPGMRVSCALHRGARVLQMHFPLNVTFGCNGLVDEELRQELLARREEDQRIRHLAAARADPDTGRLPNGLGEEWQSIDDNNTRWLADLLARRGWPGRTLVGEQAAQATWLLAQHADHDPVQQRAFLDALRAAVAVGEASAAHLAYLEDRVRANAGQSQLYGTQFTITDGALGPCPIEDPGRLDERRAQAGLEPFADYEARMRAR